MIRSHRVMVRGLLLVVVGSAPVAAATWPAPPSPQVGPHLDLGGSPAPVVGTPVRVVAGVWDGAPTEHRFAWERCRPGTLTCVPLTPAARSEYVPGADDVGASLRARVTATGEGGTGEAVTATSPLVRAAAPGGATAPAVSAPPGDAPVDVSGGLPPASGMGGRVRLRGLPAVLVRPFGAPMVLPGRIRRAGELSGRTVALRDPSGTVVDRVVTDRAGAFALRAAPTRSGTWTVEADGARAAVVVRLRPRIVGLQVTRRVAAPGVVVARGRLAPGVNGKVVELQYLDPGRGWRSWRQVRTGPGGGFALARVLSRNPSAPRFTLRVRVVVPADRGWPFAPGVSPAREVAVR